MQVRCPYCQSAVEVQQGGEFVCPQCRALFRVDLEAPRGAAQPAPAGPPVAAAPPPPAFFPVPPAAPGVVPPAGARCAKHPDLAAAGVCDRCGNFSCAQCLVPIDRGRYCPDCTERIRAAALSTPWEERNKIGGWPAFKRTVVQVLFTPTAFFRAMPRAAGYEGPVLFAILIQFAQSLLFVGFMWVLVLCFGVADFQPGMLETHAGAEAIGMLAVQSIAQVVCSPILAIIVVFVLGAIFHGGLLLFSGGRCSGFEATVRVLCYCQSVNALILVVLIPLAALAAAVGMAVGDTEAARIAAIGTQAVTGMAIAVWALAVLVIGLREAHQTTTGRAIGAVVLPVFLLFCCVGGGVFALVAALHGPLLR